MKFYYIRADGSVSVATPTPGSASLYYAYHGGRTGIFHQRGIFTNDDAHLAPFMYWILSAMCDMESLL